MVERATVDVGPASRRLWSLAQANAAIPAAKALVAQGRKALAALRDVDMHLEDLRILHGPQLALEGCPGRPEFLGLRRERAAAAREVEAVLARATAEGMHVKDLDTGLVDFRGQMGNAEAYLCWRDGEQEIRHWHPLDGGFANRKPIPVLAAPWAVQSGAP